VLRAVTLKRHHRLMVVGRAHSFARPFGAGYSIILSMQKRHATEGEVDFMDSPRFSTRLARVLSAMENRNDLHFRTNAFFLQKRKNVYIFIEQHVISNFHGNCIVIESVTGDDVLFYKLYL